MPTPTKRQQLLARIESGDLELGVNNSAGTCKVLHGEHGAYRLAQTPGASKVILGTFRRFRHDGNPGITEHLAADGSASNFKGIPTSMDFLDLCRDDLPQILQIAHATGKKLCVSINDNDFITVLEMIHTLERAGVDEVEVNLACPNLEHGEMICYVTADMRDLFELIRANCVGFKIKIGVKTGIYSNPMELVRFAKLLLEFADTIKFVTAINTFPNCRDYDDDGEPVIKSGKGYGGGSGSMLRTIALGQVAQLRDALGKDFWINGVGGISTGRDVENMLLSGANEVQLGTAFYFQDAGVFNRIQEDLSETVGTVAL